MGFEAPHHKRVFDAVRARADARTSSRPRPTSTTSAASTCSRNRAQRYVAQANNPACQADDTRIQGLRGRTAGIWFDMLGTDAMRIARKTPAFSMDQPADARRHVRSPARVTSTACGSSCSPPVGETIDCASCGCPGTDRLVSNLFGPLFPHFPNYQHASAATSTVSSSLPGHHPDGARAAPRDARHRPARADRRGRRSSTPRSNGCTTRSTMCTGRPRRLQCRRPTSGP